MKPKNIQIIGTELAIVWDDESESYFSSEFLRRHSPSAENIGEKDIFGNKYGGTGIKDFLVLQSNLGIFRETTPSVRSLVMATTVVFLAGSI